jgi:hypothetical protein
MSIATVIAIMTPTSPIVALRDRREGAWKAGFAHRASFARMELVKAEKFVPDVLTEELVEVVLGNVEERRMPPFAERLPVIGELGSPFRSVAMAPSSPDIIHGPGAAEVQETELLPVLPLGAAEVPVVSVPEVEVPLESAFWRLAGRFLCENPPVVVKPVVAPVMVKAPVKPIAAAVLPVPMALPPYAGKSKPERFIARIVRDAGRKCGWRVLSPHAALVATFNSPDCLKSEIIGAAKILGMKTTAKTTKAAALLFLQSV